MTPRDQVDEAGAATPIDPFAGRIETVAGLRELYEDPKARTVRKDIGHIDELCRRLIAACPFVVIGSHAADGRCDVTPRGGPPGFVTVLGERHLALPDATGNKRLDTLQNIVATGRVGLLFVIPGQDHTLRVNGRACVTASPDVLARIAAVGKPPRTAIVVEAEEVYAHCPKAFVRSALWSVDTWPDDDDLPSPAEVSLAHQRDPNLTLADVERTQRESLLYGLE